MDCAYHALAIGDDFGLSLFEVRVALQQGSDVGVIVHHDGIVACRIDFLKRLIYRLNQLRNRIVKPGLVEKGSNVAGLGSIGGGDKEFLALVLASNQFEYGIRGAIPEEDFPLAENDVLREMIRNYVSDNMANIQFVKEEE